MKGFLVSYFAKAFENCHSFFLNPQFEYFLSQFKRKKTGHRHTAAVEIIVVPPPFVFKSCLLTFI